TFTTGGEIVKTYFNVTQTPVGILNVSPYHGPQSTTMNVELVGLNTHFTQATTTVQFGPQITVNGVTVNSSTDLIANITTSFNDGHLPGAGDHRLPGGFAGSAEPGERLRHRDGPLFDEQRSLRIERSAGS